MKTTRLLLSVLFTLLLLVSCKPASRTEDPSRTNPPAQSSGDKSMAEKTEDAATRARRKAEALKEEQDKKAREADDAMKE